MNSVKMHLAGIALTFAGGGALAEWMKGQGSIVLSIGLLAAGFLIIWDTWRD